MYQSYLFAAISHTPHKNLIIFFKYNIKIYVFCRRMHIYEQYFIDKNQCRTMFNRNI